MEEDPPFIDCGTQRSDGSTPARRRAACRTSGRASSEPIGSRGRFRRARASMLRPKFLGIVGSLLIVISLVLIIVGVTLPTTSLSSDSSLDAMGTERDSEGVPLDALKGPDPSMIQDCTTALGDIDAYTARAIDAERQTYGEEVANMSSLQRASLLVAAKEAPLAIPIYYWVLSSPKYPWSSGFEDAIQRQTDILTAGFASMGFSFELMGVFAVSTSDEAVMTCADGELDRNRRVERNGFELVKDIMSLMDTKSAIQVVICEPGDVNGATSVLGSVSDANDAQEGIQRDRASVSGHSVFQSAIFLRRSVLWHVQTSLVHQIGHFVGLPHPYPDVKSCKFDADAIADTPPQYQPSSSCDPSAQMPLCDDQLHEELDPTQLPFRNFMDATNDTCRRFFTAGQVLRARAMLQNLRPSLYAAASRQDLGPYAPITTKGAFQSSLPPTEILSKQLHRLRSFITTAGKGTEDSLGTQNDATIPLKNSDVDSSNAHLYYTSISPFGHAQLPLDNDGNFIAIERSACVGADSQSNDTWWTAELDGSYLVHAVEIAQPWESTGHIFVDTNKDYMTVLDYLDIDGLSPSPEPEVSGDITEISSQGSMEENRSLLYVDIRIGNSLEWKDNQACTQEAVPLQYLVQTIRCDSIAEGRFVTLRWVDGSGGDANGGYKCLSRVRVLSKIVPPLLSGKGITSGIPGELLYIEKSATSVMISSIEGTSAREVDDGGVGGIISDQNDDYVDVGRTAGVYDVHNARIVDKILSGDQNLATVKSISRSEDECIETGIEDRPWWSLDIGLYDGVFVHGVRLALPRHCDEQLHSMMNNLNATITTDQSLGSRLAYLLDTNASNFQTVDVYVSMEPLVEAGYQLAHDEESRLTFQSINGSLFDSSWSVFDESKANASSICVLNATVGSGRLVDIDCGRFMPMRYLTIVRHEPQQSALCICGLRLIGGVLLNPAEELSREKQSTTPADLLMEFTDAIDDDLETCVEADDAASSQIRADIKQYGGVNVVTAWEMGFEKDQSIMGIDVRGTGLALNDSTSDMILQLFVNGSQMILSRRLSIPSGESLSIQEIGAAKNASDDVSSASALIQYAEKREGNVSLMHLVEPSLLTSSIRLMNFQSLCEVRILVTKETSDVPATTVDGISLSSLSTPLMRLPVKSAALWGSFVGKPAAALLRDAGAVVDGDPFTCVALPQEELRIASMEKHDDMHSVMMIVDLDSDISSIWSLKHPQSRTIRLLANASLENVTVAFGPSSPEYDSSQLQHCHGGEHLRMEPWKTLEVNCADINEGRVAYISFRSERVSAIAQLENSNGSEVEQRVEQYPFGDTNVLGMCEIFL